MRPAGLPLHQRDGVATPPANLRAGGAPLLVDETLVAAARSDLADLSVSARLAGARILDFGCGAGRLYYGFTTADEPAQYVGADIRREAIDWAQANIAARSPRFRYVWADVHNGRYNVRGALRVADWRDALGGPFDVIYAYSVLSHMTEADAQATLCLFADLLAPDGVVFVSAFVDPALKGVNVNPPGWGGFADTPLHVVVYEPARFEALLSPAFRIARREEKEPFRQRIYILRRA